MFKVVHCVPFGGHFWPVSLRRNVWSKGPPQAAEAFEGQIHLECYEENPSPEVKKLECILPEMTKVSARVQTSAAQTSANERRSAEKRTVIYIKPDPFYVSNRSLPQQIYDQKWHFGLFLTCTGRNGHLISRFRLAPVKKVGLYPVFTK